MFKINESDGTAASYEAMAKILHAVAPNNPVSADDLVNEDLSLGESRPHFRWLTWRAGAPAGFFAVAEETWDRAPGCFRVYAAVDPRWQGQGAGRELWNHCLPTLFGRHDVTELTCETRSDQERGIRFLQDRGFVLKKSAHESELEVIGYDLTEHLRRRRGLLAQGIEFLSLAELSADDPAWFRKYHELRMEFQADMMYPPTPLTLEEHWTEHQANRELDPSMTLVAVRDGEWMAYTALRQSGADPTLWWTSLTGVGRAHRRLGLASALKTTAIEAVQQRGGSRIRTDNDARNPMFKINQAFGFRLLPDIQTWRRPMRGEADIREVLR